MNFLTEKIAYPRIRDNKKFYCLIVYLMLSFNISSMFASCTKDEQSLLKKAFESFHGKYVIFVSKRRFMLFVYDRNGNVLKKYPIAYGLNPDKKPKLHQGDERTPEGMYRIVEILSMDADPSSEPYRKLKRMNSIWWRARDGHYKFGKKDVDLGDNAYGPRFYLLDYPNEADWMRYREAVSKNMIPTKNGIPLPIGHGIAIHGNNDPESIGHLATSGCIRMFNNDVIELEQYIVLGTPVIISSD
ncbi:MAG: L,D-transpeptidase [Spirochaetes bacterium]|nr:L,D-transpeptidase [Spirochaetota bacterium]